MHPCRYVGEWYNPPGEEGAKSLPDQKSAAVKNCWTVAGVYLAFAVLCGFFMVYYNFKAKRS